MEKNSKWLFAQTLSLVALPLTKMSDRASLLCTASNKSNYSAKDRVLNVSCSTCYGDSEDDPGVANHGNISDIPNMLL